MANRILKVSFSGSLLRLHVNLGEPHTTADSYNAVRSAIQSAFTLNDVQMKKLVCSYVDEDGDKCTLVESTVADWLYLFSEGPLRLNAEVGSDNVAGSTVQPSEERSSQVDAPGRRLLQLSESQDEATRRDAAGKLCSLLNSEEHPKLSPTAAVPLTCHSDESIRRTITDALCLLAASGNQEAVGVLKPLVLSSDEHVRRKAAHVLCARAASGEGELHDTLTLMLSSDDEHVRGAAAATTLGQTIECSKSKFPEFHRKRPREHVEPEDTIHDLTKRVASLRLDAIEGKTEAVEHLVDLTENRSQRIRHDATVALIEAASANQSSAFRTLPLLAQHSDEFIRRKAVDSLAKMASVGDGKAINALCPLTRHDDEHVRRTAAEMLCSPSVAKEKSVAALLEQLAGHDDEHIRRLAAQALLNCCWVT